MRNTTLGEIMEKIDPADLEFNHPIRCYDGVLDSISQRIVDRREFILNEIRKLEPDAHVTFFPIESQYVVHVFGRELSKYDSSKGAVLADAYNRLFS